MNINGISNVTSSYETKTKDTQTKTSNNATSSAQTTPTADDKKSTGVVYEKNSSDSYKVKNSDLVAQLKADSEQKTSQLRSLVEKMMQQQGKTIGTADDVWSFLASGDYTVDEAAKQKAQEDISENGYWGVDQTSDRILEFAKALTGGDSSKANDMLDAFKEGYKQATKAWGKDLPDISSKTYDAVLKKFDQWINGTEDATTTTELT